MFQDRKTSFKAPPSSVRETAASQAIRRTRALEEQKRRRAERIDSTRQLDILADLSLGFSDDEADNDDDAQGGTDNVVREGISQFATMLPPATGSESAGVVLPAPTGTPTSAFSESTQSPATEISMQTQERKRVRNKRKGKGRASQHGHQGGQGHDASGQSTKSKGRTGKNAKPSKWADKCMYAELLEMKEDLASGGPLTDGIPEDIETGWVAVTPIPVGKRCLAVTHQASGVAGVVPNTTLRSRVLGKPLMKPFPSPLPPQTVIDCILDDNWRENGILHVLDVLSWKGQDLADCETPFRFWWRDTRLSELEPFPPPANAAPTDAAQPQSESQPSRYQFPHPTTFAPIPYHTNTSLAHLLSALIPLARATRAIPVSMPAASSAADEESAMDLDNAAPGLVVQLEQVQAEVRSDGMLLYVAQASYEPGTSPLSNWIPLRAYQTRGEEQQQQQPGGGAGPSAAESPLNVFERLVRRRLGGSMEGVPEVEMES
ncbi:hypothetical protein C8Q80DRAFT_778538 [Daedaleopsis nitida]|nr:hypothetical protein C8Q80DRAFT_778538 [Daedaleopsis nitida]